VISRPSAGFRRLAVATAVATYLLIVWGGIVRVTGSGNGCGSATTDTGFGGSGAGTNV